jgi:hypothetical protein
MVEREKIQTKVSLWIILIVALLATLIMIYFSSDIYAQTTDQVYLQQQSIKDLVASKYPPDYSHAVLSASETVAVSVTVLQNLSIMFVEGQPILGSNHELAYTVRLDKSQLNYQIWWISPDF